MSCSACNMARRAADGDAALEGGAVEAAVRAVLLDRDFRPRPIIVRFAAVEERGLRSGGLRSVRRRGDGPWGELALGAGAGMGGKGEAP